MSDEPSDEPSRSTCEVISNTGVPKKQNKAKRGMEFTSELVAEGGLVKGDCVRNRKWPRQLVVRDCEDW